MTRSALAGAGLAAVALVSAWVLWVVLPNRYRPTAASTPPAAEVPTAAEARKIKATLFYVSEDGLHLVGVERDVAFAEDTAAQARHILEEQLKTAPVPLVQALPAGTRLRGLYVTERGEAFVDLSAEATTAHTGGSLDELFAIYAVVNALTANLPAIGAVQILVDGREVETLAGHIDLRHPLQKNLKWVQQPAAPVPPKVS